MTPSTRRIGVAATIALLSLGSLWFTKIALFAAFGTLIGYVALPALEAPEKRRIRWIYVIAALASGVGLVRFILIEAVPSLVAAANDARGQSAVSRLREILFVEDTMRKRAIVDPDHDDIGSAALLPELAARVPLRGKDMLNPPLLNESYSHFEDTRMGPAVMAYGYLFIVCLPKPGGGFSARPGDPIDEEAAERRFVAYAWPAAATKSGPTETYFIDEHERILVAENRSGTELRWAGPSFAPACDAALADSSRDAFAPWRGKKPRDVLPGDR